MKFPLQIIFRNIDRSLWLERLVEKKAKKLELFCQDIMSCRVVVERPHKHDHGANFYCMHIDISVPNDEILVSRTAYKGVTREVITVVNDAFDAAKRQLEDYVRCRRNQLKIHRPKQNEESLVKQ